MRRLSLLALCIFALIPGAALGMGSAGAGQPKTTLP